MKTKSPKPISPTHQGLRKQLKTLVEAEDHRTRKLVEMLSQSLTMNRALLHVILDHGIITLKELNEYLKESEALQLNNQKLGIRLRRPPSRWQGIKNWLKPLRRQKYTEVQRQKQEVAAPPPVAPTPSPNGAADPNPPVQP